MSFLCRQHKFPTLQGNRQNLFPFWDQLLGQFETWKSVSWHQKQRSESLSVTSQTHQSSSRRCQEQKAMYWSTSVCQMLAFGFIFPQNVLCLHKILFQYRIHCSWGDCKKYRKCVGTSDERVCLHLFMNFSNTFKYSNILVSSDFWTTFYGKYNTQKLAFLVKLDYGLLLKRPHKAWHVEQDNFCRVYYIHGLFWFRMCIEHMLLSWARAHLLIQLIPRPAQQVFQTKKWLRLGGHRQKYLNKLVLHLILYQVSICDHSQVPPGWVDAGLDLWEPVTVFLLCFEQ